MGKKRVEKKDLQNRDLLIIAVLSGIGGVTSTYVGYLGNLLNRLFGVPFGAGQFVAGLHVFWIILAVGLIRKPFAATGTGIFKGVIELLTGSTHGLVILFISLAQGILVEGVLLIRRRYRLIDYMLAGGIATSSNVFLFQLLYFSGAPRSYIFFIGFLAFISGILLAGSFSFNILEIINEVRPFRINETQGPLVDKKGKTKWISVRFGVTLVFVIAFSIGAIYYYGFIFQPPWLGPTGEIQGMVENPSSFSLSSFQSHEITINTELRGEVTYIPPKDYRGIPLGIIVQEAIPKEGAKTLVITATDGYTVSFPLEDVLGNEGIILTLEDDTLRLVAAGYHGGYWVKRVRALIVE